MILKSWEAILGILNAMIKGIILIIPLFSLQSGWLQTVLLILTSGYFSFYSCYIYIKHLGLHSDLDKSIYYHFQKSKFMAILYNFTVFLNLLLIFASYFILIVQQWMGLFSYSLWIPIGNIIFLFFLVIFLKHARFGAQLLGYGLISIVIYCVFLIWFLASAPTGSNKMPVLGTSFAPTAAAISQAFSIQQFFIPILKELHITEVKNFTRYTLIVFLLGGAIYLFICLVGAYSILNRNQLYPFKSIESYFMKGQWQVIVIYVIFLIHLYTGFVWLVLNAKKRLFCIFHMLWRVKNSRPNQFFTLAEIVFVLFCLGVSVSFYFIGVSFNFIINVNGGIIGFFFIYLIPAMLQLKCLYLPRQKSFLEIAYEFQEGKSSKQEKSHALTSRQTNKGQSTIDYNAFFKKNKIHQMQTLKFKIKICSYSFQVINNLFIEASKKHPPPQFIDLLRQSSQSNRNLLGPYRLQDQIAGADVSMDLSAKESTVSVVNSICRAKGPPTVMMKIFDLFSVAGMLMFGLFTMTVSIISLKNHD